MIDLSGDKTEEAQSVCCYNPSDCFHTAIMASKLAAKLGIDLVTEESGIKSVSFQHKGKTTNFNMYSSALAHAFLLGIAAEREMNDERLENAI